MKKEKNVVSIEERMPQLKERRKKKAARQLIFYLILLSLLIGIVIYLQSPLSHVRYVEVKGDEDLTKSEVKEVSGITGTSNLWGIDPAAVSDKIKGLPEVSSTEVRRTLTGGIEISLEEKRRIAYVKVEEQFAPILEDGTILGDALVENPGGDAPIFYGFPDNEHLTKLAKELNSLPASVSNLISEIHWMDEEDRDRVRLYMSDGYTVIASVREFSEKMPSYPSIVSQLDPDAEGVIHVGVGTYFESYAGGDKEQLETEEEQGNIPSEESPQEREEEG
ncbi:cell division protein FtsQ/DivIB [Salimicrobium jeotgali]|uniref:cell division protein FtsQ/DivIB n=1 Tax=Salimicrobium jeotgali TaxID=1230341 RepID=UPI000C83835F|nr:FtsQ-type POTRA domain-containing protein [Salimicrobium jeotgali]